MKLRPGYIKITEKHIKELKAHRERTSITEYALLSYSDPVHWVMVSKWISGEIGSTKPDNIKFVLEKWSEVPDNQGEMIELTDELKEQMRAAIGKRIRLVVFGARKDLPEGFNRQLLSRMLAKKGIRRTKKEYVDYFFMVCSSDEQT